MEYKRGDKIESADSEGEGVVTKVVPDRFQVLWVHMNWTYDSEAPYEVKFRADDKTYKVTRPEGAQPPSSASTPPSKARRLEADGGAGVPIRQLVSCTPSPLQPTPTPQLMSPMWAAGSGLVPLRPSLGGRLQRAAECFMAAARQQEADTTTAISGLQAELGKSKSQVEELTKANSAANAESRRLLSMSREKEAASMKALTEAEAASRSKTGQIADLVDKLERERRAKADADARAAAAHARAAEATAKLEPFLRAAEGLLPKKRQLE